MIKNKNSFWRLWGVVVAVSCSACAQNPSFPRPPDPPDPPELAWKNAQWRDSDAPLQKIQDEVRAMSPLSLEEKRKVLQNYEERAQTYPKDPLAIFAWAYATYEFVMADNRVSPLADQEAPPFKGDTNTLFFMFQTILPYLRAAKYDSYLFARLRFIGDIIGMGWARESTSLALRELGFKLIRKNPNDYDVMRWHYFVLKDGEAANKARIHYAKRILQAFPNEKESFLFAGHCFASSFYDSGNSAYKSKALWAYNQYGKALNPTTEARRKIELETFKRILRDNEKRFKTKKP